MEASWSQYDSAVLNISNYFVRVAILEITSTCPYPLANILSKVSEDSFLQQFGALSFEKRKLIEDVLRKVAVDRRLVFDNVSEAFWLTEGSMNYENDLFSAASNAGVFGSTVNGLDEVEKINYVGQDTIPNLDDLPRLIPLFTSIIMKKLKKSQPYIIDNIKSLLNDTDAPTARSLQLKRFNNKVEMDVVCSALVREISKNPLLVYDASSFMQPQQQQTKMCEVFWLAEQLTEELKETAKIEQTMASDRRAPRSKTDFIQNEFYDSPMYLAIVGRLASYFADKALEVFEPKVVENGDGKEKQGQEPSEVHADQEPSQGHGASGTDLEQQPIQQPTEGHEASQVELEPQQLQKQEQPPLAQQKLEEQQEQPSSVAELEQQQMEPQEPVQEPVHQEEQILPEQVSPLSEDSPSKESETKEPEPKQLVYPVSAIWDALCKGEDIVTTTINPADQTAVSKTVSLSDLYEFHHVDVTQLLYDVTRAMRRLRLMKYNSIRGKLRLGFFCAKPPIQLDANGNPINGAADSNNNNSNNSNNGDDDNFAAGSSESITVGGNGNSNSSINNNNSGINNTNSSSSNNSNNKEREIILRQLSQSLDLTSDVKSNVMSERRLAQQFPLQHRIPLAPSISFTLNDGFSSVSLNNTAKNNINSISISNNNNINNDKNRNNNKHIASGSADSIALSPTLAAQQKLSPPAQHNIVLGKLQPYQNKIVTSPAGSFQQRNGGYYHNSTQNSHYPQQQYPQHSGQHSMRSPGQPSTSPHNYNNQNKNNNNSNNSFNNSTNYNNNGYNSNNYSQNNSQYGDQQNRKSTFNPHAQPYQPPTSNSAYQPATNSAYQPAANNAYQTQGYQSAYMSNNLIVNAPQPPPHSNNNNNNNNNNNGRNISGGGNKVVYNNQSMHNMTQQQSPQLLQQSFHQSPNVQPQTTTTHNMAPSYADFVQSYTKTPTNNAQHSRQGAVKQSMGNLREMENAAALMKLTTFDHATEESFQSGFDSGFQGGLGVGSASSASSDEQDQHEPPLSFEAFRQSLQERKNQLHIEPPPEFNQYDKHQQYPHTDQYFQQKQQQQPQNKQQFQQQQPYYSPSAYKSPPQALNNSPHNNIGTNSPNHYNNNNNNSTNNGTSNSYGSGINNSNNNNNSNIFNSGNNNSSHVPQHQQQQQHLQYPETKPPGYYRKLREENKSLQQAQSPRFYSQQAAHDERQKTHNSDMGLFDLNIGGGGSGSGSGASCDSFYNNCFNNSVAFGEQQQPSHLQYNNNDTLHFSKIAPTLGNGIFSQAPVQQASVAVQQARRPLPAEELWNSLSGEW